MPFGPAAEWPRNHAGGKWTGRLEAWYPGGLPGATSDVTSELAYAVYGATALRSTAARGVVAQLSRLPNWARKLWEGGTWGEGASGGCGAGGRWLAIGTDC
eukprot:scaffold18096_cov23-Phaeocystis_antarctica.AAC.2